MTKGNAKMNRSALPIHWFVLGIAVMVFTASILFTWSGTTTAQTDPPDTFGLDEVEGQINLAAAPDDDIRLTIGKIIRAILGFLGILALLVVMYGGFVWMTAGGSADKIEQAKKILINGAIGLLIILSSFLIVQFIISKLQDALGSAPLENCTTLQTCGNGVPGGGGQQGCLANVFVAKSVTPNQDETGMNNITIRGVFTQGVGSPANDIFDVKRGLDDITEDIQFSFESESGRRVVEGIYQGPPAGSPGKFGAGDTKSPAEITPTEDQECSLMLAEGVKGSAMSFNGNDDVVTLEGASVPQTDAYTTALWAKRAVTGPVFEVVAGGSDAAVYVGFHNTQQDQVIVSYRDAAENQQTCYSDTKVSDNEWHHIAVTGQATGLIEIYIDGVKSGTSVCGHPQDVGGFSSSHRLVSRFGNYSFGSSNFPFTGLIDQAVVYDRVLTQPEISSLVSGSVVPEGPYRRWDFDIQNECRTPEFSDPSQDFCAPDTPISQGCLPESASLYTIELNKEIVSLGGEELELGKVCGSTWASDGEFIADQQVTDEDPPNISAIQLVASDGTVHSGSDMKLPSGGFYQIQATVTDNSGVGYTHMTVASLDGTDSVEWYDGPVTSSQPFNYTYDLFLGNGMPKLKEYVITLHGFDIDGNRATAIAQFAIIGTDCGPTDVGGDCGQGSGGQCTSSLDCAEGLICSPSGVCFGYPVIDNVSPMSGAAGNWVTVTGNNFGTEQGKIEFASDTNGDGIYDEDDTWAEAEVIQCSIGGSGWTDTYVVAQVPEGFAVPSLTSVQLVTTQSEEDLTPYQDAGIAFDGLGSGEGAVVIEDSPELRLVNGGTIITWIKPFSSGEGGVGRIIDMSTGDAGHNGYRFGFTGDNIVFIGNGGAGANLQAQGEVVYGEWQMVVVSFDAGGAKIFVNGVDKTSTVTLEGGPMKNVPGKVVIGNRADGNSGALSNATFDGGIDEVAIFDEALSPEAIASLFLKGTESTVFDYQSSVLALEPVGYWPMNERTGGSVEDIAGDHTGIVVSGPDVTVNGIFENASNIIEGAEEFYFSDNTTNNIGPKPGSQEGQFGINDIERPGLCGIEVAATVPDLAGGAVGPPLTPVVLEGVGFNGTVQTFFGGVLGDDGSLVGGIASDFNAWDATVDPAILQSRVSGNTSPGKVSVYVTVDGPDGPQSSNGVPFKVSGAGDEISGPVILDILPAISSPLSYVTIVGSNFGIAEGRVFVATSLTGVATCLYPDDPGYIDEVTGLSKDESCRQLDIPDACGAAWTDEQIVVELSDDGAGIPPAPTYHVLVESGDTQLISSGLDTVEVLDALPFPSICSLEPNSGPAPRPNGDPITIDGKFFSEPASIFFQGIDAVVADPPTFDDAWLSTSTQPTGSGFGISEFEITTNIPINDYGQSMVDGFIYVTTTAGTSNPVKYDVTDCTLASENQVTTMNSQGFHCCSEQKEGEPNPDYGLWKPNSFACIGEERKAGYVWRFTTGLFPNTPRVAEECTQNSVPSPTPWQGWSGGDNSCQNASIVTRFVGRDDKFIPMDPDSLIGRVRVYTCGTDDTSLCVGEEAEEETDLENITGVEDVTDKYEVNYYSGGPLVIREIPPAEKYQLDTWYHVELDQGITSLEEVTELGNKEIKKYDLEVTAPCGRDTAYCFEFKTSDEEKLCVLADVVIHPHLYTTHILGLLALPPGSPNPLYYRLFGRGDQACTALPVDGLGWKWGPTPDEGLEAYTDQLAGQLVGSDGEFIFEDSRAAVTALVDKPSGVEISASLDDDDLGITQSDVLELSGFGKPFVKGTDPSFYSKSPTSLIYDNDIDPRDHHLIDDPEIVNFKGTYKMYISFTLDDYPLTEPYVDFDPTSLLPGENHIEHRDIFSYRGGGGVATAAENHGLHITQIWWNIEGELKLNRSLILSYNNTLDGAADQQGVLLDPDTNVYDLTIEYGDKNIKLFDGGDVLIELDDLSASEGFFATDLNQLWLGGIAQNLQKVLYGTIHDFRLETLDNPLLVGTGSDLSGTTTLFIDVGDPQVVYYEPNCNEACVNSIIMAQFNRQMVSTTYIDGFSILKCVDLADPDCVETDPVPGSYDLSNFKSGDDYTMRFVPPANFEKNSRYKVTLSDSIYAVGGLNPDGSFIPGKSLEPFTWYFKTKDDGTPCEASQIRVFPDPFTAREIGEKTLYSAIPYSQPDQCSKFGQALNPHGYLYDWESAEENIVEITNFNRSFAIAPYCDVATCLPVGSDLPSSIDAKDLALCGNAQIDAGEDCDIGIDGTLGCSLNCLFEGTAPGTCGNGVIDAGEQCDPKKDGDDDISKLSPYCSEDTCLLEGAVAETATGFCGDGIVAFNESCDTGILFGEAEEPNQSGVGCSALCLHTGSKPINAFCLDPVAVGDPACEQSMSICGNGVLEKGEECEVGGASDVKDAHCNDRCLLQDDPDDSLCDEPYAQCSADEDGCSPGCTLEGSSALYGEPSLCGDGEVGFGEVSSPVCETAIPLGAGASGAGANQIATAIGEFDSGSDDQITKIKSSFAADATIFGEGDYTLSCGFTEYAEPLPAPDADSVLYNDCAANLDNEKGVASANNCCMPRPRRIESYPADLAGFGDVPGVCPNTQIRVTFDDVISGSSVSAENFVIARGYAGVGVDCGDAQDVTGLVSSAIAYGDGLSATNPSVWQRIWDGVRTFFARLFGFSAHASHFGGAVGDIQTWCAEPITMFPTIKNIDTNLDGEPDRSEIALNIQDALVPQTAYVTLIKGGPEGVQNTMGVSIKHPDHVSRDDAWVFETLDEACKLDEVAVIPPSFLFNLPNTTSTFEARALSNQGGILREITPTTDYDWTYHWGPQNNALFAIPAEGPSDSNIAILGSTSIEGELTASAIAEVVTDDLGGSNDVGKRAVGPTELTALFCERPWPAFGADGEWDSYKDQVFNFKMNYCASAGVAGVVEDDLPFLSVGVDGEGATCSVSGAACTTEDQCPRVYHNNDYYVDLSAGVKHCLTTFGGGNSYVIEAPTYTPFNVAGKTYSQYKAVSCTTDADCQNPASYDVGVNPVLGMVEVDGASPSGFGGWTNTENVLSTAYCGEPAEVGALAQNQQCGNISLLSNAQTLKQKLFFNDRNEDVVGMQIFQNPERFSAQQWYNDRFATGASLQSCSGNTFDCVTDGDNYYINAFNVVNTENDTLDSFYKSFNNIVLLSVNEGAQGDTKEVIEQLVESLVFNTNLTDEGYCLNDGADLHSEDGPYDYDDQFTCSTDFECRDADGNPFDGLSGECSVAKTKYFRDHDRLSHVKSIQEKLTSNKPALAGGTFIPGYSVSKWGSWAQELDLQSYKDPLNAWTSCEGEASTCYNAASSTFSCPFFASVYEYEHKGVGLDEYDLYMQLEYFQNEAKVEQNFPDLIIDPDSFVHGRWCQPDQTYTPFSGACGDGVVGPGEECEPSNTPFISKTGFVTEAASDCGFSSYDVSCSVDIDCLVGNYVGGIKIPGYSTLVTDVCNYKTGAMYDANNVVDGEIQMFQCSSDADCLDVSTYGQGTSIKTTADLSEEPFAIAADTFSSLGESNFKCSIAWHDSIGWVEWTNHFGGSCPAPEIVETVVSCPGSTSAVNLCDASCQIQYGSCQEAQTCGNGVVEGGEVCDDGKLNSTYGNCADDCGSFAADYCGDGKLDLPHEFCDWEESNAYSDTNSLWALDQEDSCAYDCKGTGTYCGDGIVQEQFEDCDDANDNNADTCSNTCEHSNPICLEQDPQYYSGPMPGNDDEHIFMITRIADNDFAQWSEQLEQTGGTGKINYPGIKHIKECFEGMNGDKICQAAGLTCETVYEMSEDVVTDPAAFATWVGYSCGASLDAKVSGDPAFKTWAVRCSGDYSPVTPAQAPAEEPQCGNGVKEDQSTHPESQYQDKWEACDNGGQNGISCDPAYGESCTYCTSDCKAVITVDSPFFCGNGEVDEAQGESCDWTTTGGEQQVIYSGLHIEGTTGSGIFTDLPITCKDKGVVQCVNECGGPPNTSNCVECRAYNYEELPDSDDPQKRPIPKVAIINPILSDGNNWSSVVNTNKEKYRFETRLFRTFDPVTETETKLLGRGKIAHYNEDNSPEEPVIGWTVNSKVPGEYQEVFTSPDWGPFDAGLEPGPLCQGEYEIVFNAERVYQEEVGGTADDNEEIKEVLDSGLADSFPYPVGSEESIIRNDIVYSPAVPQGTHRAVVRWGDSVGTHTEIAGGIFGTSVLNAAGVNNEVISYTAVAAESHLCGHAVEVPSSGLWLPAQSGSYACTGYNWLSGFVFAHPQVGSGSDTNVQAYTLQTQYPASGDRKIGFWVKLTNGQRIGSQAYKLSDIYVDVYGHHEGQNDKYSVFKPMRHPDFPDDEARDGYTFRIKDSANSSSNQSAEYWHVFNLERVGNEYVIVPKEKILTGFCELKSSIIGVSPLPGNGIDECDI